MSSIIVAQANNRVIGSNNDIPWYLPTDLRHFREITSGKVVIMGRLTFESIKARLNGPLPNRRNIVISGSLKQTVIEGFEICASVDELKNIVDLSSDDVFIIGGGQIYTRVLDDNLVNKIYLTQVNLDIAGDTYFPELDPNDWLEVDRESHKKDEKNKYDYDFIELVKKV
jgi:dihydrofolate reductase